MTHFSSTWTEFRRQLPKWMALPTVDYARQSTDWGKNNMTIVYLYKNKNEITFANF